MRHGGTLRLEADGPARDDLAVEQIELCRLAEHRLRADAGPEPEGVVIARVDQRRARRFAGDQREREQRGERPRADGRPTNNI
jgi:hypothetical protein